MVDFSKHKHGDVVVVHCCDECARNAGVNPKRPADSGKASWLCDVCGHHGIGSLTDCEIGAWLRLRPLQPNTAVNDAMEFDGRYAIGHGHYEIRLAVLECKCRIDSEVNPEDEDPSIEDLAELAGRVA